MPSAHGLERSFETVQPRSESSGHEDYSNTAQYELVHVSSDSQAPCEGSGSLAPVGAVRACGESGFRPFRGRVRLPWPSAFPRSALGEPGVRRGQVCPAGIAAVPLDLPADVVEKVFAPIADTSRYQPGGSALDITRALSGLARQSLSVMKRAAAAQHGRGGPRLIGLERVQRHVHQSTVCPGRRG